MNATSKGNRSLMERIESQPGLREKIEKLVTIAEAAAGTPDSLDDIEGLILHEGRELQKDILQKWANSKHESIATATNSNTDLRQSGKKK
jgi:hypothetical protein